MSAPNIDYRRSKRARRLSITIVADGTVRVAVPQRVPMLLAHQFVQTKMPWIKKHHDRVKERLAIFTEGDLIGKQHTLHFKKRPVATISSRISQEQVTVYLPLEAMFDDPAVQAEARTAIIRSLRQQAKEYLPERVEELALRYGFRYKDVRIKQLRSRWGSCSTAKNINLNLHLMSLADKFIDYVILHELVHTEELNHSPRFWAKLEACVPNARVITKQLKQYHPYL